MVATQKKKKKKMSHREGPLARPPKKNKKPFRPLTRLKINTRKEKREDKRKKKRKGKVGRRKGGFLSRIKVLQVFESAPYGKKGDGALGGREGKVREHTFGEKG